MLAKAGTYSKAPAAYGLPQTAIVSQAQGAKILVEDRWLVDWPSGLGTNLLGYGAFTAPAAIAPSLATTAEVRTAEKLAAYVARYVPGLCSPAVRFAKTGSEVTTMAVQLARAVTGRSLIVTFRGHYHGWHSWTAQRVPPARGVIQTGSVIEIDWQDRQQLETVLPKAAAVIFEHPAHEPEVGWPAFLRYACDQTGTLLIADEVVTGFRYAPGGICELYGYEPDLVCYGKALGNGYPISALVGDRDLMHEFAVESPVFCSSTLWGETGALAAADWFLGQWDKDKVEHVWRVGQLVIDQLRAAGLDVFGDPPRSVIRFESDRQRGNFIRAMFQRGHLLNRPQLPNAAHALRDAASLGNAAAVVMSRLEDDGGPEPLVLFKNR